MKSSEERSENVFFFSPQANPKTPSPGEKDISFNQHSISILPLLLELTDRVRGSMAAMKTLAFYSLENFKDRELGEYFHGVVTEDIEKTISLLDCFYEYLNLNNPIRKINTINTMLEEIIKEKQPELDKKNIRIVKKKFEQNLPETSLTDEQLNFILNSIFDYILLSSPLNGGMGILTRSIESNQWNGEEKGSLQKDTKYIEILILSKYANFLRQIENPLVSIPGENEEERMDLILQLVKKTLENHRGAMKTKGHTRKEMNVISLVLPIERRNVFKFSPQKKLEKVD
jgi:hypothetical protein